MSAMALRFAQEFADETTTVSAAVLHDGNYQHPLAADSMAEAGLPLGEDGPPALAEVDLTAVDVVVTLCSEASRSFRSVLPGQPTQIDWTLPHPATSDRQEADPHAMQASLRQLRAELRARCECLFQYGTLETIGEQRRLATLILENLSEGVIVHDLNRKILYFNRAAEEITGHARATVVGHDCHDVFTPSLCGKDCHFCDGRPPDADDLRYPVELVTRRGERRQIEMAVHAIKQDGAMLGVLGRFRDVTREHTMARRLGEIEQFSGIIGRDHKMLDLYDLIRSVAESNAPVLVQGESGTGKELVAAAIHNESPRSNRLFVPVNCGALPEGLLESELFGHMRGAFTGAVRDKKGRFELADGGTIFLDEIGDISPAMQVKLLRVLQEGQFEAVGSTKTQSVDVRVISATNKDLLAEIEAGRFREDLYYRLCVVPVMLPPLRDRRGDIPLLADAILKRASMEAGRNIHTISRDANNVMLEYHWPGNVRELQNAIQYALVKCHGSTIELSDLPPTLTGKPWSARPHAVDTSATARPAKRGRRRKLDVATVRDALRESAGNKVEATKLLGVSRATLYRFLDNHPEVLEE